MTSKTPSYNRMLEAERKKVALRAAEAEEDAADAIELRRAEREARAHTYQAVLDAVVEVTFDALDAWKQVAQWRIGAWVDEQTGDRPSSRGFHRGPAWAHLAAFGTGLLGLALPIVIVLVNI